LKLEIIINCLIKKKKCSLGSSLLQDVVIVSICGGNRDLLINPELTDLAPIAPPTHSFNAFTTGIPYVWTSTDHQVRNFLNLIMLYIF